MYTYVWKSGNTTVDIQAYDQDEAYSELERRIEEARVNLQIDVGYANNFELDTRY